MTDRNDKRRLKLTISYDGRPWQGWQSQPNGLSIQDQVQTALGVVAKQPLIIEGSGRTDAGVHALAQIAHCDVPETLRMAPHNWVRALNAVLPPSISVTGCEFAAPDFHARFQTTGKIYRYRIWRADVMSPFEVGRAWHVYGALDTALLRRCAARLVGTHNFARLSANRGDLSEALRRADPRTTTRTIQRVEVVESAEVLTFEIEGSGFLYKMVRMITGSLMQIARGRDSEAWFNEFLDDPSGVKTNQCAVPDGLYLVRVKY
ncbi:MAG: tRNA pseudouridine synthase [Verrucomicrobiaceae bacterium]|nr:tRNA pseudouridine synthase [Verrucomicrobiaceae bacterium]